LNDRLLKSLKPAPAGKRYDVMDTVVPAMGVRVTDKAHREGKRVVANHVTFFLAARFPSKPKIYTRRELGQYGKLTLDKARAKARRWIELIHSGVDPKTDEERQARERLRAQKNTFLAVAEDFISKKLSTERKGKEVERDIRREFITAWGGRPAAEITPQDVKALIEAVKARGAVYQAHNLLTHMRRLFTWAIDQDDYGLDSSPCDRIKPAVLIGKKLPRKRILSDDEIRAFWRAVARQPYPYRQTCQLLLLTGQRHGEVAGARWSEFHPELAALLRRADKGEAIAWPKVKTEWKLWCVGAERFKSDWDHMVPLSDDACAVLATVPLFRTGDHLFSTTFGESRTVVSDKAKGRVDARMLRTLKAMARRRGDDPARIEPKDWVLHDLRRTLRTHLSALRIPDHISEMVIGHGRQGLQRVYDQHRYLDEMREALTLWAPRLRGIVEPAPTNVVKLPMRA
jgi:integrase